MSNTTSAQEREIPKRLFLIVCKAYDECNEARKLPYSDERERLLELIGFAYDAAIDLWGKAAKPEGALPDNLMPHPTAPP